MKRVFRSLVLFLIIISMFASCIVFVPEKKRGHEQARDQKPGNSKPEQKQKPRK